MDLRLERDMSATLERELECAREDLNAVRSLFMAHVRSDFLHCFVRAGLQSLEQNPDHVIRRTAGQTSFTLINTKSFDYTIRLLPPFKGCPHSVKWHGERQILSVKGTGSISVRLLSVPCDINHFQAGVQLTDVEPVNLQCGSFIESSTIDILDVYEVTAPVVVEVLTIHDEKVELHWTFDEHLRSRFAEASRMTCSRLQNMLELAYKMGKPVPPDVYEVILAEGNAQLKLLAIQSMLVNDSAAGFRELQQAIESQDVTLSTGAQRLFDVLMTRG